jgi:hypothetical protein
MEERRRYRRQRVLKGAIIFFNRERSSMDCIVRDLTEVGAHLKVESTSFVPTRFELLIKQENTLYPAEIIWRDTKAMGIRFTGAARRLHE